MFKGAEASRSRTVHTMRPRAWGRAFWHLFALAVRSTTYRQCPPRSAAACGHGVCAWRLNLTCLLVAGQCAVPVQRGDADATTQQQCARFVSFVFAGALRVCAARAGMHASLHASMRARKQLPESSANAFSLQLFVDPPCVSVLCIDTSDQSGGSILCLSSFC